jgi:PAS domain S-box-containing protein
MAGTEMISQDLLHDTQRLSAVNDYLPIVASAFSRAARSAARATGMPFSLVCILDGQDIHFKGMYGLELRQTKRALPDNVSLLIPERFTQTNQPEALGVLNQLFASRSGWQKYFFAFQAAVPLRGADGHILGALVVLDEQIRELNLRDVAVLEDCADALVAELDLRRQIAALEERRTSGFEAGFESASGFQGAPLEAHDAPLSESSVDGFSPDDSFLEDNFSPTSNFLPDDHFHPGRIADSSPVALVAETLDGTMTYWNAAAERLLGHTAEQVLGQNISLVIPNGRVDLAQDELELLRAGQYSTEVMTVRLHADGRELPVRVSFAPILDKQGITVGILSAVNPQIHSLQTAPEAEPVMPALVFSINIDGFFTACHGAPLLEVLSDHRQVIGQTCFRLLETHESLLEAICVGLLGEEFEFSFQSGAGLQVRAYVHPMFEAGLPSGVCGLIVPAR